MPAAAPAPQPLLRAKRNALRRWLSRLAPPSARGPEGRRDEAPREPGDTPSFAILFSAALVLLGMSIYLAGTGSLMLAILAAVVGLLPAGELAARLLRAVTPDAPRRTDL